MENITTEEKKVFTDRKRTNILRNLEQPVLVFLCRILPRFITPDMLTATGILGSFMVLLGFLIARTPELKGFLFLSIFGFAVNWFGDSMDGRIAYFRETPRKWYGFALDCMMDWMSLVTIGIGYYFYVQGDFRIYVFTFCCAYAWAMLVAQIRYKITNVYSIDSGLLGPTEVRVIICLVILSEYLWSGSMELFSIVVNIILILTNTIDTVKLIKLGDERDISERKQKEASL